MPNIQMFQFVGRMSKLVNYPAMYCTSSAVQVTDEYLRHSLGTVSVEDIDGDGTASQDAEANHQGNETVNAHVPSFPGVDTYNTTLPISAPSQQQQPLRLFNEQIEPTVSTPLL